MADVRSLEHPTLKVPYESLNKRFRSAQKVIEREVTYALGAVEDVERALTDQQPSAERCVAAIDTLLERLEACDAKTREAVDAEVAAAENCKLRLQHLRRGCPEAGGNATTISLWRKTRLDRMLVEHFLRSGFYNSAIRLAGASGIGELTNIGLFLVAKEVEEALAAKDTSKCLAWCHDNKSKMRKMKSTLEFNVRMQEFVELVKQGRKTEAVTHARKYLSGNASDPETLSVVQRGMALLALPSNTKVPVYQELLREDRWQLLVEQFRRENYRLFQLSNQSVFSVALQAGLSSLKTQRCSKRPLSDRNSECPVCQSPLHELASQLPYAHCSQSRLICYISGNPLNEHNQPMMLPNGFVYGEEALSKMAAENDGQVVCPRTKEIYAFSSAEKVYVM